MHRVSICSWVRVALVILTVAVSGAWATLPALAGTPWPTASPSAATPLIDPKSATVARTGRAALHGRSMWIWYLNRSAGGDLAAIIARARAAHVGALLIKSSDGEHRWRQFSPRLVRALHRGGLRVCAWQYVYGTRPLGEAGAGVRAARDGADCLIIDAESEYEGRYAAAQRYLRALRSALGLRYPIALASFPYVNLHPAFPFSVFLGPGGAQYNLPQMYWRDIGASVADVFHHTYTYNRVYRRPIFPLGQTYGAPSATEVKSFRAMTVRYAAPGISWWDFAWTSADALWPTLNLAFVPVGAVRPLGYPVLRRGSQGDDVLWLQEHLARVYPAQRLTGTFAGQTAGHLRAFQARRGLAVTGRTDPATWRALLTRGPVRVSWTAGARRATATRTQAGGVRAPESAALPARAYEIPELGAQHPARRAGITDPRP